MHREFGYREESVSRVVRIGLDYYNLFRVFVVSFAESRQMIQPRRRGLGG